MVNLFTTPYASCLKRLAHTPDSFSGEQVVRAKLTAINSDPFAMELAKRLAIADTSRQIGLSFRGCYQSYGADLIAGMAWVQITIICLEDKILGQGRHGSIVAHPVLDEFPKLHDIPAARKNDDVVQVARRFQAAYETMKRFEPKGPHNRGVSSFDRHLARISEPEPLWVVLAGLSRLLIKSLVHVSH